MNLALTILSPHCSLIQTFLFPICAWKGRYRHWQERRKVTGKVLLELEPSQIALYSVDQLILKGNSKMPFTGPHFSGNFHYSDRCLLILGGYLRDYLINTSMRSSIMNTEAIICSVNIVSSVFDIVISHQVVVEWISETWPPYCQIP